VTPAGGKGKALAGAQGNGMDLKRLAVVVFQRLAPIYIAVALSWVTGYAVFTIGGIGLAIALELAWPLLRPLGEVLYEELLAQHSQAQALRRTALLKTFVIAQPGSNKERTGERAFWMA